MRNYKDTIEYLYSLLPVFHRDGKAALKPGLDNTLKLCEYVGNPQDQLKCVHVAGTNGKGSSSHYLSAIYQSAGYKVGLYTSPHLVDYRERFKINGQWIPEAFVVDFVNKVDDFIKELQPSFFEVSVAMAFCFFKENKVDIAIIETGLGGRLDSTNVITPIGCLITNIGLDHTDLLGDTLEKIATEKAGIIKPSIPVIISEKTDNLVDQVFINAANNASSPIYFAEESFSALSQNHNLTEQTLIISNLENQSQSTITTDQLGTYQSKNIIGVLKTIEVLQSKFQVNSTAIVNGFKNSKKLSGLQGRWEIINQNPLAIADVGHNSHGLKTLKAQLSAFSTVHLVLGFVHDKDVNSIISLFPSDAQYYFCEPETNRALSIKQLKTLTEHLNAKYFHSPQEAYNVALSKANETDFIYIGGSTFVVSALNYFKNA